MGVNIKQATYCGPKGFGDTHGDPGSYIPDSGSPQPLLDTSNSSGPGPGVNIKQATYSGYPGNPSKAYDMPTSASIPTGSTDVQNPEATGSDVTPADILKGSKSNG